MQQSESPASGGPERHSVAVYCPVRNCPELLDECLRHLRWVDEIVIADASDNHEIRDLLKTTHPAARHFFDKTEDNRVRLQHWVPEIRSDFILLVDADEFYTPAAGEEILEALRKPCRFAGFIIPSVSYCYGAGLGPGAAQLRLFRKDRFSYRMENIHELPEVDGPVETLRQPYHHHNNPILGVTAVKHFRYEAVNAAALSDAELAARNLDSYGRARFWGNVGLNLLRANVRFLRSCYAHRSLGFAGLCLAYSEMLRCIAAHVCPTEERRKRTGAITKDRRGYY